jgi:Transposase domain (DUF772)
MRDIVFRQRRTVKRSRRQRSRPASRTSWPSRSPSFPLFNLEERIPAHHLLRRINPIVTRVLADLREKLAPFYSDIGRPSIDPELMIRMLIVGYCYGIRFERRLCEEVELQQHRLSGVVRNTRHSFLRLRVLRGFSARIQFMSVGVDFHGVTIIGMPPCGSSSESLSTHA